MDTETLVPFHIQNERGTAVSSSIDTLYHMFYMRIPQGLLKEEIDACLFLLNEGQEMPDSVMTCPSPCHASGVVTNVQDEF
jgi:hypothetical protein